MPSEQSSLGPVMHSLHELNVPEATSELGSSPFRLPARRFPLRVFLVALSAVLALETSVSAQSRESTPSHQEVAAASANTAGSSYIPVDSWIYSAALRLYYLGYLPTAYLGLRDRKSVV